MLQLVVSGSAEVAAGLSNLGEERWAPRESDGSRISMHGSFRSCHLGHSRSLRGFPGFQDPGIGAILEARDSQEAPGTLQRAWDGFPNAIGIATACLEKS